MKHPDAAVLGAGSWGTALANVLAGRGLAVKLWGHRAEHIEEIRRTRENIGYLPGVRLPALVECTASLASVAGADPIVFVTPSRALRAVAQQLAAVSIAPGTVLISATKGIEQGSGLRMSEILAEMFPGHPIAVLSGPSHAEEVARDMPAAVVLGAADLTVARELQAIFSTPFLRIYSSDDVAGIELGGALKNVFAIAAGVSDGLGLGDNSKAGLVTRALAELIRLGTALGGQRETFHGLSGIGDLIVTCFSQHSRNRRVGERLGRGESLDTITTSMNMIAEGVPTTRSAYQCARRVGLRTPIIDEVHAILESGKAPREAMRELLARDVKAETE